MSTLEDVCDQQLDDSLSSQFQKVLDMNEELNNSSLPTNDKKFQEKVNIAIEYLEEMTRNVNCLGVFSVNESMEEISTENLKYLLLPALLADFTLKNQQHDRIDILETSQIYYKDFITRLNDYQFCNIELYNNEDVSNRNYSSVDSLIRAANARNSKIHRYKQIKELEQQLISLKELIIQQKHSGQPLDEGVERKFYMKLIHCWLNRGLDELANIEAEIPMVKMREATLKTNNEKDSSNMNLKPQKKKPFKPIIITKNEVQKKVFGLGYPSMPTYSVDEFVQQKINEGSLKLTDKKIYSNSLYDWANNPDKKKEEIETEDEKKELLLEKEDPAEMTRLRRWDDWKDEHRIGEGNRHNMG